MPQQPQQQSTSFDSLEQQMTSIMATTKIFDVKTLSAISANCRQKKKEKTATTIHQ